MVKNKNRRREINPSPKTNFATVTEKIPLVSVIIPVFNAEKFLPQTLESLLCQTMTDFEVVAVDDCSTDNSVAVLESFAPKLLRGGVKLHVVKLATNSGTPAVPRNIGINFARGKYIAFLDSDDLYTKSALEELSTLAEKHQAEVIHTDGFYMLDDAKFQGATIEKILDAENYPVVFCNPHSPRLKEPTGIPENFEERVKLWLNNDYHWATWATFCRRDFLVANQISFSHIPVTDDVPFNFACLCLSKINLRIPNINYIYRVHEDSVTSKHNDLEKVFRRWVSNLNGGFNAFNKIMSRFEFFNEHLDYRYAVLDWFFNKVIQQGRQLQSAYAQFHPALLDRFVEKEFRTDDAAFSAYLFNTVNLQRLHIMMLQQENAELKKFHKQ